MVCLGFTCLGQAMQGYIQLFYQSTQQLIMIFEPDPSSLTQSAVVTIWTVEQMQKYNQAVP